MRAGRSARSVVQAEGAVIRKAATIALCVLSALASSALFGSPVALGNGGGSHASGDDNGNGGIARPLSGTSFHDFNAGVSVGYQQQLKEGWSVFPVGNCGPYDEKVVSFGSNKVWRVSNAVTCGSFGDQPFAPRPGGIPTNTVTDPDNSEPLFFAGEASTGAAARGFLSQFSFRSATGAFQSGLRITISIDNGEGGRQSFAALVDTPTGINVETFDVANDGTFVGPITIATGLSHTAWHTLVMEATFKNGPSNDKVRYFVNGNLVHTNGSWEQFYRNFQAAQHPLGVPVQTLLFRISGTAAPTVLGNGYYIDDVFTSVFSSQNDTPDGDDDDFDDDGDRDDGDRDDDNDGQDDDEDSDDDNDGQNDNADNDDDNDGIEDDFDSESAREFQQANTDVIEGGQEKAYDLSADANSLLLTATAEAIDATDALNQSLTVEIYNPSGVLVAKSPAVLGRVVAAAVPALPGTYKVKIRNTGSETLQYRALRINRTI